jgi:hypothetical protein
VINPKPSANNPRGDHLTSLDRCSMTQGPADSPAGGLLGRDYLVAPPGFLHGDAADPNAPTG